jgi:ATP-dependent Clp endopeptidase proteolytic subunit ClpP
VLQSKEGMGLQLQGAEARLATLQGDKTELELIQVQREVEMQQRLLNTPLRCPFQGDVSEGLMASIQQGLQQASDMFPGRAVEVVLNTRGGSIVDGLMQYNFIGRLRKERGHHFTITALGQAASMGSILLQAADWRIIGPDARILIHMPSGGFGGNLKDARIWIEQMEDMWDQLAEALAARSTMTKEEIKAKVESIGDWWLTSKEALRLGFVDAILEVPNPKTSTPPPAAGSWNKQPEAVDAGHGTAADAAATAS